MTYKVMVVDDAAMMRLYISSFLKTLPDFTMIAQANNGQEALDKLEENPDVDLILLDIEMPVMDGIECLRRLKILSPAKVIVLSSLTHPASPKAVEARLVGADAVIGKPSGSVSKDVDASGGGLLIDTITRLLAPAPAGAAP